jgi:pimeloyl-ACP methyl ester carboxylesterase
MSILLPRPGGAPISSETLIPGPTEAAFTSVFGTLLPSAKYIHTAKGQAAYYELPPSLKCNELQVPDCVLLVHGVQTPALGMLPLARALQATCPSAHFVLIDLWGHGLSDTPVYPHEPSLFHGLMDALLDELKWPTAHLVGYSLGGLLTIGYVISRPSRVQSYTLIAPAGLMRSSDLTAEDVGKLHGDDEVAAREWVVNFLEGGELVVPSDWKERVARGEVVAEAVREWQMREHPGHMATVVAVIRDAGVMDSHAEFIKALRTGIPSFAILGELDGVCSEQDLNRVGFNHVAVVPQVGHGVVRERVPEVVNLIRNFWMSIHSNSIG